MSHKGDPFLINQRGGGWIQCTPPSGRNRGLRSKDKSCAKMVLEAKSYALRRMERIK